MKKLTQACIMLLSISAGAQTGDTLFYEDYHLTEKTRYLIPDTVDLSSLSEWDWIKMKPVAIVTKHTTWIGEDFSRHSSIEYTGPANSTNGTTGPSQLVISPIESVMYDGGGTEISALPHSEEYLRVEDTIKKNLIEYGFNPLKPFPPFSELNTAEIEAEGLFVEELLDGAYRIFDASVSYTFNPDENLRVSLHYLEKYDGPYFKLEKFTKSPQGYLMPKLIRTKQREYTLDGRCIIKTRTQSYQDYQAYYKPEMVYDANSENQVASEFSLFPNPASDHFEIQYTGSNYLATDYEVTLTNQMGETVLQQDLNTSTGEYLDISGLPDGYYIIHFNIASQTFHKNLFKNL